MAGWETNATYAKQIDADKYINKAQAARNGKYKGVQTKASGAGKGYDLRGINATKIQGMIDYYIQTECRKLRLHLCTLLQKSLRLSAITAFSSLF